MYPARPLIIALPTALAFREGGNKASLNPISLRVMLCRAHVLSVGLG